MIVSIKLDEPDRKHSAAAKREIALFPFSVPPTPNSAFVILRVRFVVKKT